MTKTTSVALFSCILLSAFSANAKVCFLPDSETCSDNFDFSISEQENSCENLGTLSSCPPNHICTFEACSEKYYVTGCPNGYILKNGYCQYETEDAYIVLNAPPAQGGVSSHQTMTFYFYDENGNPSFDGTTTVTALPTYTANVGYSNMSWSPYNPLGKTFTLDELRQEWPKFSVIFTSIIPPPTQP